MLTCHPTWHPIGIKNLKKVFQGFRKKKSEKTEKRRKKKGLVSQRKREGEGRESYGSSGKACCPSTNDGRRPSLGSGKPLKWCSESFRSIQLMNDVKKKINLSTTFTSAAFTNDKGNGSQPFPSGFT